MALKDLLQAFVPAIQGACSVAGITVPGEVGIGWPVATELTKILGQPGAQCQITVYPQPGARNVSRYRPETRVLTPPTVTLTQSVSGNVLTFGGTPQGGLNVHAFCDVPQPDALYKTTGTDTLASIASGVAAAITALGRSGLSATSSGAAVTVTGCKTLSCNIGGSVSSVMGAEVGRVAQRVQVSVWANDPATRQSIQDAIVGGIGTLASLWLDLADGSEAYVEFETQSQRDDSQSSYSCYEAHIIFGCEYGVHQLVSATEVEAGIATITPQVGSPITEYTAGS